VARSLAAEALGDRQLHDELLAKALAAAPDFARAHWQLGQVQYQGSWRNVNEVPELASRDEKLARYQQMRTTYNGDEAGQRILIRWCDKQQLTAQARAHAGQFLEQHPDDPEMLKILNLSWHDGLLVSPEQIAQAKLRTKQAAQDRRHWQPLLIDLRKRAENAASDERQSALAELSAIEDPAAIESLEIAFKNHDGLLRNVVGVIGRMKGPESTAALVRLALLAKSLEVRREACTELGKRQLQSYVPQLVGALAKVETRVEIVTERDRVRVRETVERENATRKTAKSVETDVSLIVPNPNLAVIVDDVYREMLWNNKHTAKVIENSKRRLAALNETVYWVLENSTGVSLPHEPEQWWNWWRDYNVLSMPEKPLLDDVVAEAIELPFEAYITPDIPMYTPIATRNHACFANGTEVWTLNGPVAIEAIQVGDQVLAQDPKTGQLDYRPVLATTLGNAPFIEIEAGDERISATAGHVFWVSGQGWRMAKDLKVGDRLHANTGWVEIEGLKPVPADETHNLVVREFNTYFVGRNRLLTHDITMMQPNLAGVPGQGER
jgi:hypothetical protein